MAVDFSGLATRVLRLLPPERAHAVALRALATGIVRRRPPAVPPGLAIRLLGCDFANPLGLAAGFDKDAVAMAGLLGLGFGFVEVGTVTPRPQPGNPRPRLFRIPEAEALINRMGLNNRGIEALRARLEARPARGIVGVNVGCNRDSPDRIADYEAGVARLGGLADYLVINVSSPNTPGLRALERARALADLLARVLAARPIEARRAPLLVKISPDLEGPELADLVAVARDAGIDGLVVGNTTTAREGLPGRWREVAGGLSGRPLFARSTAVLAETYRLSGGRLPLIGVGGVLDGDDAYAKVRAGASLIQIFTAFIYRGPGVIDAILEGLARRLAADGFATLAEAVGTGVEAVESR